MSVFHAKGLWSPVALEIVCLLDRASPCGCARPGGSGEACRSEDLVCKYLLMRLFRFFYVAEVHGIEFNAKGDHFISMLSALFY